MSNILIEAVVYAIGVAISPLAIMMMAFLLLTKRARKNGIAYLLGWVVALTVMGVGIAALLYAGKVLPKPGSPSTLSYVIRLVLGILLLFLALRTWQKRRTSGEELQLPDWTKALDSLNTWKSLILGVWFCLYPKNFLLTSAIAVSIIQGGLSGAQAFITYTLYVTLASLPIAALLLYYLKAGASADTTFNNMKAWLITNNTIVLIVMALIFGSILVIRGLLGLIGG